MKVFMSATVDAERFSKYLDSASILNVPRRPFPVQVQYLEDELTGFPSLTTDFRRDSPTLITKVMLGDATNTDPSNSLNAEYTGKPWVESAKTKTKMIPTSSN